MFWLLHALGIDDTSGRWYGFWSGFGSDLAIIGAVGASAWALVRRMVAHHKERMGQAERHHAEHVTQLLARHNEATHQAERHHGRLLDALAMTSPAAEPQAPSTAANSRARKTKVTP